MDHLKNSSADKALRAMKIAQGLLQAGFTTLRTAGDADIYYPTFAVAKSIDRGDFIGPKIVGAGHYISVTVGQPTAFICELLIVMCVYYREEAEISIHYPLKTATAAQQMVS